MTGVHLGHRVVRSLGFVFGAVPGWYMLLVEPWARRLTGSTVARSAGVRLDLDLAEFVQRKHYFRSFERRELRFIRTRLRPGERFVDIGANVGILTMQAGRAVGPTGHVVAAEPIPSNVERLRGNAALQPGRIDIVETAIADRGGPLSLGLSQHQHEVGNAGSYSADATERSIEVEAATLDDLLDAHLDDGDLVHLLKIDVEGMEHAVIAGATRSLASGRIAAVMFERNPSMGDAGPDDLLRAAGFEVFRCGLGGRLRRAGPTDRARSTTSPTGPGGQVRAWLRGDTRLDTVVAVAPPTAADSR